MVKVCELPDVTETWPEGEMLPPEPALALMAKVSMTKLAAMVCDAATLLKVNELTAPTELPSTSTSATWKVCAGTMLKEMLPPGATV